ncbi:MULTISPECIES: hypothetical protein [unclassified Mesorhizobium]|uniref:hypothetical protein n=1 Tax=unclassified Mesorhizobium TaxID=325217 RepID=UPI0015E454CC|nr:MULTISPECIES: hypothetical protein [unclassified Mesorhizobium]
MKTLRWMAHQYLAEGDRWRIACVEVFGLVWRNAFFQAFFWLMVAGNLLAMFFGDSLIR